VFEGACRKATVALPTRTPWIVKSAAAPTWLKAVATSVLELEAVITAAATWSPSVS
jgi:hypothetical protein